MNRTILFALLLAGLISTTGCVPTTVPFTQSLIDEYQLEPDDLKHLQYYVSDQVVLTHESASSGKELRGAGLKSFSNRAVHEVKISKALPGIAEEAYANRLEISFKEGSQFRFLLNNGQGGKFYMTPSSIKDGYYIFIYDGNEYKTHSTSHVYLMVEHSGLSKFRKTSEILPGRRVER